MTALTGRTSRTETPLVPQPVPLTIAATHTHSAPAATPAFQSNPSFDYQIFLAERINPP